MAQRQFRSDDTSGWQEKFGNGADGALTISSNTTDSPINATCTGTAGTTSLAATNGSFVANQPIIIHQTKGSGVGSWELNVISSYSAGTITLKYPLINTYNSGAQVQVIKQYSTLTINGGNALTASAWNGSVGGLLVYLVSGLASIPGTFSIAGNNGSASLSAIMVAGGSGAGFAGGQGNNTQTNGGSGANAFQGDGTPGAGTQSSAANGNGGGACTSNKVSDGGFGAGGGNVNAGTNGGVTANGTSGTGGSSVGSADLTTANFGGGGGGGVGQGNFHTTGGGGGGGGFCLLIAKIITITGSGNGNGGNAGSGTNKGGGGGAGGSILFKCQTATLGASLVTASGGSGGGDSGGGGSQGRIHIDYSNSFTGTTTPSIDPRLDTSLNTKFFGGMI